MLTTPNCDAAAGPATYVAAHQQMVYTFCYRSLGRAQAARGVAQRAFEQAWPPQHPDSARQEALRLLEIAYRGVLKQAPQGQAMRLVRQGQARPDGDAAPADVQTLLATLPVENRCVAVLRCCCGLTPEEVSTVTGLPADTVRACVIETYRALARWSLAMHACVPTIGSEVADGHLFESSVFSV